MFITSVTILEKKFAKMRNWFWQWSSRIATPPRFRCYSFSPVQVILGMDSIGYGDPQAHPR